MRKRSPLVPAADMPDLPVAMNSELSASVLEGLFTRFLPISFTLGQKTAFWTPLMRPLHLLTYFYYLLIAGLLLTPVARADVAIGRHGDGVEAPAILQPVLVSLANKISPDGSSPSFNAPFSPRHRPDHGFLQAADHSSSHGFLLHPRGRGRSRGPLHRSRAGRRAREAPRSFPAEGPRNSRGHPLICSPFQCQHLCLL